MSKLWRLHRSLFRERGGRWLRIGLRVSCVLGAIFFLLAVRVVTASSAELAEAERLRERGDLGAAIAHYRRAARWYAPGNPYSVEALDRLAEIARRAEEIGDSDLALAAWRSVRGAVLGARSFYIPHSERLSEADEHIASILGALPPPPIDAARSPEERRALHLTLLRDVRRPSVGWGLLALIGLATWLGAGFAFLIRAVDEDDRIIARPAQLWGTIWIVGFGLFAIGLTMA
jgi:hypothetical protein